MNISHAFWLQHIAQNHRKHQSQKVNGIDTPPTNEPIFAFFNGFTSIHNDHNKARQHKKIIDSQISKAKNPMQRSMIEWKYMTIEYRNVVNNNGNGSKKSGGGELRKIQGYIFFSTVKPALTTSAKGFSRIYWATLSEYLPLVK